MAINANKISQWKSHEHPEFRQLLGTSLLAGKVAEKVAVPALPAKSCWILPLDGLLTGKQVIPPTPTQDQPTTTHQDPNTRRKRALSVIFVMEDVRMSFARVSPLLTSCRLSPIP
jgi:hypothetical protein